MNCDCQRNGLHNVYITPGRGLPTEALSVKGACTDIAAQMGGQPARVSVHARQVEASGFVSRKGARTCRAN